MDTQLFDRIESVCQNCHQLITAVFAEEFPIAGNIGIFAQSDAEYQRFKAISIDNVYPSSNPNQKYFQLKKPVIINSSGVEFTFTHLYIRKFDPTDYGKNKGDVDFVVDQQRYAEIKLEVMDGKYPGAEVYERPGWDNIQVNRENFDVVSYLGTQAMAEKARIKFDNLTNI